MISIVQMCFETAESVTVSRSCRLCLPLTPLWEAGEEAVGLRRFLEAKA